MVMTKITLWLQETDGRKADVMFSFLDHSSEDVQDVELVVDDRINKKKVSQHYPTMIAAWKDTNRLVRDVWL